MDAIVEVATAGVVATTGTLVAKATRVFTFVSNALSQVVATSTPVLSMGAHSISAVAPDNDFMNRSIALGACA